MSDRDQILEWTSSGRLPPRNAARAFAIAGITPNAADWRRFVDLLLLWLGILLLAAGVIFFFAYNWASLPRFAKFAIAEFLLIAAVVAAWLRGADSGLGKTGLTAAAIFTGALLALVGQTYQTGADTYQLFLAWAGLILPFALIARFAPLWLLWVGLLNVTISLYLPLRWFSPGQLDYRSWALFGLNAVSLAAWEFGAANGLKWLLPWGARLLAVPMGIYITELVVRSVTREHLSDPLPLVVYFVWLIVMFACYRVWRLDVFMLAGAMLSIIVCVTAFLIRAVLSHGEFAGGVLMVGLMIIGLSAAGGMWIRNLLRGQSKVSSA